MEGVGKITIFGPHSQHTHVYKVRKKEKRKKRRERRRRWHVISCEPFSLRCIAARVKCCHHEIQTEVMGLKRGFPNEILWFVLCRK